MNIKTTVLAFSIPASFAVLTAQAPPAPTVDRVGFPANYQTTFTKLLTFDRPDNGQIRVVWANPVAAATPFWERYPYGSVLLFESWTSKRDADNNILLDKDGRFIPNVLGTLFVKRKEPGFGEEYKQNRNGEWEYIAYRPDGTVSTTPQNTGACAVCHIEAGPQNDWTFRRDRYNHGSGAVPTATMSHYKFLPGDMTVKKGSVVTWYNDDPVQHIIFVPALGFNSDAMTYGATYSHSMDMVGDFEIRCTIHPGMRSRIKVVE